MKMNLGFYDVFTYILRHTWKENLAENLSFIAFVIDKADLFVPLGVSVSFPPAMYQKVCPKGLSNNGDAIPRPHSGWGLSRWRFRKGFWSSHRRDSMTRIPHHRESSSDKYACTHIYSLFFRCASEQTLTHHWLPSLLGIQGSSLCFCLCSVYLLTQYAQCFLVTFLTSWRTTLPQFT